MSATMRGVDITKVDPMLLASLVRHVRALRTELGGEPLAGTEAERRVVLAAEQLVEWCELEVES